MCGYICPSSLSTSSTQDDCAPTEIGMCDLGFPRQYFTWFMPLPLGNVTFIVSGIRGDRFLIDERYLRWLTSSYIAAHVRMGFTGNHYPAEDAPVHIARVFGDADPVKMRAYESTVPPSDPYGHMKSLRAWRPVSCCSLRPPLRKRRLRSHSCSSATHRRSQASGVVSTA